MPTGYTATLMEKGQTFETFVMTCARAFGALINMRDDPLNAPIPKKFEPSKHYVDSLAAAQQEAGRLARFSKVRQLDFGAKKRTERIKQTKGWIAKETLENKRIDGMVAKVTGWMPPTTEHEELKTFMLQQLKISRNSVGYNMLELAKAKDRTAMDYYQLALGEAERNITYYEEQLQKEIERAGTRTEWVAQLRKSL